MRRWPFVLVVALVTAVLLSGCGPKSVDDVMSDLSKRMEKMDSYKGNGKMTLMTGEKPLEYLVEVWYKQPNYYRIMLKNDEKNVTQIVLRNDEGVFVLTPHLNKTFRFQSNWPENQGQVYLMQTLVQSINDDQQRKFTDQKDSFIFDVAANYQNSMLARQKIQFLKDSYAPKTIEVFDKSSVKLVQMDFNTFEYDFKFDDRAFVTQKNMTGWLHPTLSSEDELHEKMADNTTPTLAETVGKEVNGTSVPAKPQPQPQSQSFGVIEPGYLPKGVVKRDMQEFQLGEHKAVMLRYSGDYHFTLTESQPQTTTVSALNGQLVDLGHTFAVLLGEEQKTLTWTEEGVEFKLTTANLAHDEMVKVAQSVMGQVGK
jgi:outer membrane lipoprotein-sorting protein